MNADEIKRRRNQERALFLIKEKPYFSTIKSFRFSEIIF